MSAKPLLLSLFEYKAWANRELFAELAKLDASSHPAERHAAIRMLNHIHVVDRIFAAHLAGQPHSYTGTNTADTPTLEALSAEVDACDQWYVEHVRTLAADRLGERIAFSFTDGERGSMSREEMLAHVATHGSYHRGVAGRIMVQAGVPPPRDIFTVFLHRAEPERRA